MHTDGDWKTYVKRAGEQPQMLGGGRHAGSNAAVEATSMVNKPADNKQLLERLIAVQRRGEAPSCQHRLPPPGSVEGPRTCPAGLQAHAGHESARLSQHACQWHGAIRMPVHIHAHPRHSVGAQQHISRRCLRTWPAIEVREVTAGQGLLHLLKGRCATHPAALTPHPPHA